MSSTTRPPSDLMPLSMFLTMHGCSILTTASDGTSRAGDGTSGLGCWSRSGAGGGSYRRPTSSSSMGAASRRGVCWRERAGAGDALLGGGFYIFLEASPAFTH